MLVEMRGGFRKLGRKSCRNYDSRWWFFFFSFHAQVMEVAGTYRASALNDGVRIMTRELAIIYDRKHGMYEVLLSPIVVRRKPILAMLLHPASKHIIHLLSYSLHFSGKPFHRVQPAEKRDDIRDHEQPQ